MDHFNTCPELGERYKASWPYEIKAKLLLRILTPLLSFNDDNASNSYHRENSGV
jgi:hypothetical protein